MTQGAAEERHATWLELFFDLVIVVAVAQLAHLLREDPGRHEVFLFAVLYYAMWTVWTSFTLYANVSGTLTRTRAMLLAMFGIAIMAASVPQVVRGEPRPFIIAYIACRLLAAGSWKRTSRVMTEWSGVQQAGAVIPWIASLGFGPPVRYWLWVAGIALDVAFSIGRSRDPEVLLAREQKDLDDERRAAERRRAWLRRLRLPVGDPPPAVPGLQEAHPDRPHLGERLGLFVIIVLGEAVAQLVDAAADVPHWDKALLLTLVAGFGLLVALWWLTLRYGAGAAPVYGVRVFALRFTMPAHYLTTGSIIVLAAGLGGLAGLGAEPVPTPTRWVLCAGAAVFFLTGGLLGVRGGASRRWILGWALPATLASVLLGLLGGPLPAWALAAVLLAVALWHVAYRRVDTVRAQPEPVGAG